MITSQYIIALLTHVSTSMLLVIFILIIFAGFLLKKYLKKFLQMDVTFSTWVKLTLIPSLHFYATYIAIVIVCSSIIVYFIPGSLFENHQLDSYVFFMPIVWYLTAIAVYFFSLKNKLIKNSVSQEIAKVISENVTKYSIWLSILLYFAFSITQIL